MLADPAVELARACSTAVASAVPVSRGVRIALSSSGVWVRRHASIPIRRQSMTTAEIEQAIQLYQAGNSLTVVGTKLGYDHGTIHQALNRPVVPCAIVMGGSGDAAEPYR